jgi:hypothetical protein
MLAVAVGAIVAHVGMGATTADAWTDPPLTAAGQQVRLVFTLNSTDEIDAKVMERVTCRFISPTGESTTECDRAGAPVEARTLGPTSRSFTFYVTAPSSVGKYDVQFFATSLVGVPPSPATVRANTSFRVVPVANLPPAGTPGSNPGGHPSGTPSATGAPAPTGATQPPPEPTIVGAKTLGGRSIASATGRWFISSTVATTVLMTAFVAGRSRSGGVP